MAIFGAGHGHSGSILSPGASLTPRPPPGQVCRPGGARHPCLHRLRRAVGHKTQQQSSAPGRHGWDDRTRNRFDPYRSSPRLQRPLEERPWTSPGAARPRIRRVRRARGTAARLADRHDLSRPTPPRGGRPHRRFRVRRTAPVRDSSLGRVRTKDASVAARARTRSAVDGGTGAVWLRRAGFA